MGRALALLLLATAASGCSELARPRASGAEGEAPAPSNPEPDYPAAVRQPTGSEAARIAAACGTRARPARMPDGLLRLAAWAVYEPVDATSAQARCFYHRIRPLVARPPPDR